MPTRKVWDSGLVSVVQTTMRPDEVVQVANNPRDPNTADTHGPIWHPMIVARGLLTFTPPGGGQPEARMRGSTNNRQEAYGPGQFEAGPTGCAYYCFIPRGLFEYEREPMVLPQHGTWQPQLGATETLVVIAEGTVELVETGRQRSGVWLLELTQARTLRAVGGPLLALGLRR